MEKSLFVTYIQKFLSGIVLKIVTKLNGKVDGKPPRYRFKEMLTPKYSITGKWETLIGDYKNVKADLVAMDSELPLKKRPSLGQASGDIPKSGMRKWLNETQMTTLQTLEKLGKVIQLVKELFKDVVACITGVYENNEYLFLFGLSTGQALVTDEDNVGIGARLEYGYLNENKFGVADLWSNPATAKPKEDLDRMFEQADGNISILMMDRKTIKQIGASEQVRLLFAFKDGVVADASKIPNLSNDQVSEWLKNEYSADVDIVERSIISEKNGKQTKLTPWQEGIIIGIPDKNVGDLVWAETAEANAPVGGVEYATIEDYMLVSMYRKNEPSVSEHTRIQARVFPVITNVELIYQMDTKTIQA